MNLFYFSLNILFQVMSNLGKGIVKEIHCKHKGANRYILNDLRGI